MKVYPGMLMKTHDLKNDFGDIRGMLMKTKPLILMNRECCRNKRRKALARDARKASGHSRKPPGGKPLDGSVRRRGDCARAGVAPFQESPKPFCWSVTSFKSQTFQSGPGRWRGCLLPTAHCLPLLANAPMTAPRLG